MPATTQQDFVVRIIDYDDDFYDDDDGREYCDRIKLNWHASLPKPDVDESVRIEYDEREDDDDDWSSNYNFGKVVSVSDTEFVLEIDFDNFSEDCSYCDLRINHMYLDEKDGRPTIYRRGTTKVPASKTTTKKETPMTKKVTPAAKRPVGEAILGAMFKKVEATFDLSTNRLAIVKADGQLATLVIDESGDSSIDLNPIDIASVTIPVYATRRNPEDIAIGDIYVFGSTGNEIGFVVKIGEKQLEVLTANSTVKRVNKQKSTMMGTNGFMVARAPKVDASNPLITMALLDDGEFDSDTLGLMLAVTGNSDAKPGDISALLPFLLGSGDGDSDISSILPFLLMQGGGAAGGAGGAFSNPLVLMSLLKGDDGDSGGISKLLPFLLMQGQGAAGAEGAANPMSNPLVLMSLLGGDDDGGGISKILPFLLMQNQAPAADGTVAPSPFSNPLVLMSLLGKGGDSDGIGSLLPLLLAGGGGFGGAAGATGAQDPMQFLLFSKLLK